MPTEPVPPVMTPASGTNTVVAPQELPKKGPGLLWLVVILAVAIVGGSIYFLYAQLQKPAEDAGFTPRSVTTQESEPDQGFGAQPSPATVTPTITSSDSVSDIEKDLSGVVIESGNSSEFDADLQSLE